MGIPSTTFPCMLCRFPSFGISLKTKPMQVFPSFSKQEGKTKAGVPFFPLSGCTRTVDTCSPASPASWNLPLSKIRWPFLHSTVRATLPHAHCLGRLPAPQRSCRAYKKYFLIKARRAHPSPHRGPPGEAAAGLPLPPCGQGTPAGAPRGPPPALP